MSKPNTVEEYIEAAPDYAREKLNELRTLLKTVAPNAEEAIKWGQPVLIEKRILFSYAAHKKHLSFMPTGPSLEPFRKELTGFATGQDTIRLAYDQALPAALIRKIAQYRYRDVTDNDAKWMY